MKPLPKVDEAVVDAFFAEIMAVTREAETVLEGKRLLVCGGVLVNLVSRWLRSYPSQDRGRLMADMRKAALALAEEMDAP